MLSYPTYIYFIRSNSMVTRLLFDLISDYLPIIYL